MGFPQPDTGSVTEDMGVVGGLLTTSGDAGIGPFFTNDNGAWTPDTISGALGGTLVIEDDGVWDYQIDNSTAAIQALDTGETLTEVFTVQSVLGTTTITITINGADEPPCFVSGTLIDTPQGPRPVEDLRAGDQVLTRDNGIQTIRWAGHRDVDLATPDPGLDLNPIRVCKDAIAPGVPNRDLLLSPKHSVLLSGAQVMLLTGTDEVLCPVKHLLNGDTIRRETPATVGYHHLLFDTHQVVQSSGLASESFYPGRIGLEGFEDEARQEVLSLFPELRSLPDTYGPMARVVAKRHEAHLLGETLRPAPRFVSSLLDRVA